MNKTHCSKSTILPLGLLVYGCLAPTLARAQVDDQMLTLAQKAVTWVQGLAMSLCIVAVIRAGLTFLDEEKAPHAWNRMKVTLFGCAVVYGSVGIVQFIKAHFSAQGF